MLFVHTTHTERAFNVSVNPHIDQPVSGQAMAPDFCLYRPLIKNSVLSTQLIKLWAEAISVMDVKVVNNIIYQISVVGSIAVVHYTYSQTSHCIVSQSL